MKKLLVTGGMGFIGSNFILHMLSRYDDLHVTNIDALTYAGNPDNVSDIAHSGAHRFVRADITDAEHVERIFAGERFDAVVHFAAESHVDRSIAQPEAFIRANVLGTFHLLEAAKRHKIPKFIHVSTDEVYGTLGDTGYFTEQSPLMPNSPYSASKAGSDLMARSYAQTYGLPVIITRCSNNYGPRQFPEKLIPTIILRALHDEPIPIYGDGTHVRDWLYVMDHCAAIDAALRRGKAGEVYNIGGHHERTNLEVASMVLQELGKPESLITFVADRLGHDKRYAIDPEKTERELGWRPIKELEQGMKETIRWYVTNRSWWERVRSGAYLEGR
ncbi:dTDP-glucose 4,6-dehydratase [Paenibacillus apiarius]|uniref:dTDP-glucose 4,6-dehydratase n=1 Tax=Paenibacillus apiarius TaxID=46240 RepID=A0ABT4DYN5_9BACL|nr:dTDP-glucose 4,6-dehydratase [Paenibacillus apiarius]MCY9516455.1 dTDP-glucose 4,6-dehydratase [Paenibacillus apiarius]MCY9522446.1 dTDP-glucose 4,6-dehydratase [Paenibacillus apiarius]MCY9554630.1 dTDP-glucose 4,6-dehydratase [Paenibacillus apiarius]MCY9556746.1 dTDP-glucose 4,6-dehydratase [Paenibacillus apiarius]MCY9686573.1 dTDP-glucose 4,6-dehydratase [Paenibacillus apiarius]